jgi:hypothetical protein
VAFGTTSTYHAEDFCSGPANTIAQEWFRSPGNLHTVVLSGLELGAQYSYQFGNDVDGWSATYQFNTRFVYGFCQYWLMMDADRLILRRRFLSSRMLTWARPTALALWPPR